MAIMKLQLALEWFLNPDHLPLIAGIELGWFAQAGLELELIAPDDHYHGHWPGRVFLQRAVAHDR